ncbi:MAG: GNAT family N-acetyltransferase [Oceanicaulis sp.]
MRDARHGDLVPLYELWQAASHASPHHLTDDQRREMALAFRDRHMPSATLLVAAGENGRLLGCLGYEPSEHGALIDGMWIDPAHQGEGVGRSFIDQLKAQFHRVEATVNTGARDLRGFYAALGFEEARRDGADEEGAYPDVTLVWSRNQRS